MEQNQDMRLLFTAPALLFLSVASVCQVPDATPQMRRVRADLDFLTSDALQGRASLTREADVTARYIASEFARLGLQPGAAGSYLQEFPLVAYRTDSRSRGLAMVKGGARKAFRGPEFSVAFGRDVAIMAPVAFVGYGITAPEYRYDDYAGVDVRGKVALMFDHEPQEDDARSVFNGTGHTIHAGRAMKLANARRHGAVAILIASEPGRSHLGMYDPPKPGTPPRPALRASAPAQMLDDPGQIPAFSIADGVLMELLSGERAADLQRRIDAKLQPNSFVLPDTTVELRSANAETRRGISLNTLALLEGSDPALKSETVLITAHYDHLGYQNGRLYAGANDNGSGVAGLLELARMYVEGGRRPKRSILFAAFGSEEQAMLGSFYYVQHPVRPLETTRAVVNLDMIARDEEDLKLVGTYYSADLLRTIERESEAVGLKLNTALDREYSQNALFRCDHLPFLFERIPAVWLFGGFHPGYHEPVDTVDRLDFTKMEKTIRLAYRVAEVVANEARPPAFGK